MKESFNHACNVYYSIFLLALRQRQLDRPEANVPDDGTSLLRLKLRRT